jgi:hypothetical protein
MATAMPGSQAQMVLAVGAASQGTSAADASPGCGQPEPRGQVTGAGPAPGGREADSYPLSQPSPPSQHYRGALLCVQIERYDRIVLQSG